MVRITGAGGRYGLTAERNGQLWGIDGSPTPQEWRLSLPSPLSPSLLPASLIQETDVFRL